jgi:hypothetical protein
MLSLFDYLGKPAGVELGDKVYKSAKASKISTSIRNVHTKNYSGKVMLYPKEFLDSYFNKQ